MSVSELQIHCFFPILRLQNRKVTLSNTRFTFAVNTNYGIQTTKIGAIAVLLVLAPIAHTDSTSAASTNDWRKIRYVDFEYHLAKDAV